MRLNLRSLFPVCLKTSELFQLGGNRCPCMCVNVWLNVLWVFLGCLLLTLSVWSICSLMEVARAKCRAPSCCLRHPRWHALCPSPCLTLKSSARPLTADSAHPHLRVSHSHLPLPTTNPHYHPSHPDLERPMQTGFLLQFGQVGVKTSSVPNQGPNFG